MSRSIPGTVAIEGREFMYIEIFGGERFSTLLDDEEQLGSEIPMPKSGGAMEEKARLSLQGGASLIAISYKGDVPGWRKRFIACCEKKGRRWGIPKDQTLVLSDGTTLSLPESNTTFDP
jgi:hypothetical protein